jgi:hypothetical protein
MKLDKLNLILIVWILKGVYEKMPRAIQDWMKKYPLRNMVRIDRSPMNDKIWIIQLDCKHDITITQTRKPKGSKFHCYCCNPNLK